jgi:hypothetical protein
MTLEKRLICLTKAINDEVELRNIERRIEAIAHGIMQYTAVHPSVASYYFPIMETAAISTFGFISGLAIMPLVNNQPAVNQQSLPAQIESPATTLRLGSVATPSPRPEPGATAPSRGESRSAESLFASAKSPGSIAVCAAEGNCSVDGSQTSIYSGHVDPGNHVRNKGFCSWNHAEGISVEEGDRRCTKALQEQSAATIIQLRSFGIEPDQNLEAVIQGTDLWNQSNSAGPQFASKYKMALSKGMTSSKAYLWARVEAFRRRWGALDASGLFGICTSQPFYIPRLRQYTQFSEEWQWNCIALDQGRRIRQIEKTLEIANASGYAGIF